MSRTPTSPGSRQTCARILDGALELFNRDGSSSVTTNHIAAHVGISPGNLYYWFADKDEIVRALFARYTDEHAVLWDAVATSGARTTPAELFDHLATASRLTAAYRFLGRDLLALVHTDVELGATYAAVRESRLAAFRALARAWRSAGIVQALSDERLDDTVRALWIVAETWWSFAELDTRGAGEPDARDGERLLRAVLEPLLVGAP